MDDNKTQESKKTVVAFIVGLIIGGLLVWTFSASPEGAEVDERPNTTATSTQVGDRTADTKKDDSPVTITKKEPVAGNFTFTVANQSQGNTVSLGEGVKYPSDQGWIVVHEEVNGQLGSALGAARYETGVGLLPKQVELLRSTEAGKTYRVVYYTESGDRKFDRKEDVPMTAQGGGLVATTFKAE